MNGVSPRLMGNPSPHETEGGRPLPSPAAGDFARSFKAAFPEPVGAPSLHGAEGGRSLTPRQAAEQKIDEYATYFVNQMVRSMRATVQKSGLVDGGHAEETFQGELDLRMSADLAKSLKFHRFFAQSLDRLERKDATPLKDISQAGR